MSTVRPHAVEYQWSSDHAHTPSGYAHGTVLLWEGHFQAGRRDASFLRCPDTQTYKVNHVVVASQRYAVGDGMCTIAAACDPARIMIYDVGITDAADTNPKGRCRRPACRSLFHQAERERASIEHIRNYYGLALHGGMRVEQADRAGTIVGYRGQYVEVLFDGEDRPLPCHPTENMTYPPGAQVGPGPDERFAHLVEVRS